MQDSTFSPLFLHTSFEVLDAETQSYFAGEQSSSKWYENERNQTAPARVAYRISSHGPDKLGDLGDIVIQKTDKACKINFYHASKPNESDLDHEILQRWSQVNSIGRPYGDCLWVGGVDMVIQKWNARPNTNGGLSFDAVGAVEALKQSFGQECVFWHGERQRVFSSLVDSYVIHTANKEAQYEELSFHLGDKFHKTPIVCGEIDVQIYSRVGKAAGLLGYPIIGESMISFLEEGAYDRLLTDEELAAHLDNDCPCNNWRVNVDQVKAVQTLKVATHPEKLLDILKPLIGCHALIGNSKGGYDSESGEVIRRIQLTTDAHLLVWSSHFRHRSEDPAMVFVALPDRIRAVCLCLDLTKLFDDVCRELERISMSRQVDSNLIQTQSSDTYEVHSRPLTNSEHEQLVIQHVSERGNWRELVRLCFKLADAREICRKFGWSDLNAPNKRAGELRKTLRKKGLNQELISQIVPYRNKSTN